MAGIKRKKCINCKDLFIPDPRNANRQEYCCKPECRKASKVASQRCWLAKPENRDYFSGPENVKRVQLWREANPGYWRRKRKNNQDALQDFLFAQPSVLLGLIANFTGNALQDNMVMTLQRLQELGQDIVTNSTHSKGGHYGIEGSHRCRTDPKSPQALQLDRSPPNPGPAY